MSTEIYEDTDEPGYDGVIHLAVKNNAHTKAFDCIDEACEGRPSRILGVGCASGYFGAVLRQYGHEVWGVEASPRAAAVAQERLNQVYQGGIRLRRDSWVSVMYAEALHSTTSSVTLQRTDRHGILGQKSSHCQMSWCPRQAECATYCPPDGVCHKQCASSPAGHGAARSPSGVLVVGNGRRPPVVNAPGGGHALYFRSQTWCGDGHDERVLGSSAS